MSYLNTPRTGAYTRGSILSRTFASLKDQFAIWNDARVTRKALNALSLRELEDIGLTRGDIDDMYR